MIMRDYFLLILAGFITACSQDTGAERTDNTPDKKIIKQVTAIAVKYATDQLKNPNKIVESDGTIIINDDQKRYVIEPRRIITGMIDKDQYKDALISIDTYHGSYQAVSEQLIIIKQGGKFILAIALESDMKILAIKDGIITAEVPTHSRNSPLFNCPSCREVVNYQFRLGELIRME
jgi:hypothetical protein